MISTRSNIFDRFVPVFSFISIFVATTQSLSTALTAPPCQDKRSNRQLEQMNPTVLEWKKTSANQYLARARINGVYMGELRNRDSHKHWSIQIGPDATDKIELIYNKSFGDLPSSEELRIGEPIEICGDYITSNAPTGRYEASPLGAIIHWTHINPGDRDGGAHEHGYVMLMGRIFGHDYVRPNGNQNTNNPSRRKPRRPNLFEGLMQPLYAPLQALAQ